MAKQWAKSFYNSKKWKECRSGYISIRQSIDGGMCELCKQNLGYIVHHKETLTSNNVSNPEISLNYDMLMYVCHDCHNKIDHFNSDLTQRDNRYIFDEFGNVIFI